MKIAMKTDEEWAKEIVKFFGDNPVNSLVAATEQIRQVVKKVQDDAVKSLETPPVLN